MVKVSDAHTGLISSFWAPDKCTANDHRTGAVWRSECTPLLHRTTSAAGRRIRRREDRQKNAVQGNNKSDYDARISERHSCGTFSFHLLRKTSDVSILPITDH
jgi:hypothetical protein